MSFILKIWNKLIWLCRRYILREPFLLEVDRWLEDCGDERLRLDYPLTSESIVFDLGGYHGDFAAAIYERYRCKIYIFEPVPAFYQICTERFKGNNKVICFDYGLSSVDGWLDITLAEDASSFASTVASDALQQVQVRSVVDCIQKLGVEKIDLMKINIEGGEYDVLPAIIKSTDISKVQYLQIQFHNFVDQAVKLRSEIRNQLKDTHLEMWNYDFVWESWSLKRVAH